MKSMEHILDSNIESSIINLDTTTKNYDISNQTQNVAKQNEIIQSTLSRLSYAKYPNGIGPIDMTNLAIESLKNREFKNYINEFYDNDKNGWAWHIKFIDIKQDKIYYTLVKKAPKIGNLRALPTEETTLEINISQHQYNSIIGT
ncbi:MAG: hypothetical protein PHC75_01905 [Burkholderiales bacterium]|nr:hypothetical protein [Burkholderiales bacterium]